MGNDNLTAKELQTLRGIGNKNLFPIEVGEFQFFVYAEKDINSPYGKGKVFIHLEEKDSYFENTIDFMKQTVDTDGMIRHIKQELKNLAKRIEKIA